MMGLVARSIFARDHLGKQLGVPGEVAVQQPGFEGSKFGNTNLQMEQWHVTAPSDMGRAEVVEEQFVARNGDMDPRPVNLNYHGQGMADAWRPLWQEPHIQAEAKRLEYEWDFLTPHGPVEDVLLMRRNLTTAPRQAPHVTPLVRPIGKPVMIKGK